MTDTLLEAQRNGYEAAHPELCCPTCDNSKDESDPHCYSEACTKAWADAHNCDDCGTEHDGIKCAS